MPPQRPNIILVYTDQQRYDTLGSSGNGLIRTPASDRMAEEGVCFSRSYVTCPLCLPSRVALWTGRYNHANRNYNNGRMMHPREVDFATRFREAGYHTALIGKNHCFPPDRLAEAFDYSRVVNHDGWADPQTDVERRDRAYRQDKMQVPFAADPMPAEENLTAQVFGEAMAFLDQPPTEPYLLWLSVPDPHPPYMVSEPYASMYDDTPLPPPAWREGEMADKPYRQQLLVEWNRYDHDYPGDRIDRLRRIYWGMVSCIDDHLGRLLDRLRASGADQNTLVIFTSDHGDHMGDHRLIRKSVNLYEELVHVPLIVWGGGVTPGLTDAMVSNIDLMPTLAEFAGVDTPEGVHGSSFAGVLRGERATHRQTVFMEHGNPGSPLQPGGLTVAQNEELAASPGHHLSDAVSRGRVKAVRTDRYKYCHTPGDVDELYDIHEDPHELVNLANNPAHAETIHACRAKLLDWAIETEDTTWP